MKILIVDDIKENRSFLEFLLKSNGYEVVSAENGKDALEKLSGNSFKMIISDILMPVMDGFELCRRIKKDGNLKNIPFVFYTATYTNKEDEEFAMGLGASKFIRKPQEPEKFLKIVKEIITNTESGKIKSKTIHLSEDKEIFKLYNERLINKLEKKTLELKNEKKERKKIEKEINMLAHAVKSISECVCVTDMNENILFVNDSFIKTYGYSKDELIGKSVYLIRSSNNPKEIIENIYSQTLKGGWKGELFQTKKDGSEFPVALSTSVIHDEENKAIAIIGVISDVSERRSLEEKIRQTQKMEAIGRLAGGVSHDLNNLLTPILGYGEILMDEFSPNDKRKELLDQIVRAGFRARDLVRQLLAFSRKQSLEYKPLNLNKVVTGFEKLLRRTIREDIKIKINLFSDIRTIMADIGQFEQVIMNLSVNAQDAMPEGGTLILETGMVNLDENLATDHPGTEVGKYVMLAISDTGCGMNEETQKHIFEPFFSTKGEDGTGLGLATVYGIVKQHGGTIWVYSEIGNGTTFKIYLPVSGKAHVEAKTRKKSDEKLQGSETIMLVEDNKQVLDLTHTILKRLGYSVIVAKNGAEALKLLTSHNGSVNLLLTDMIMPGMNGKKLLVKATMKFPDLKVLYMSGYTGNAIVNRGFLEKDAAFIQKPFTVQELAVKVREVLDK